MSWTAHFLAPISKDASDEELRGALATTPEVLEGPMLDQFKAATDALIPLIRMTPGPKITVNMSGHANGVGWQKKDGWGNDYISINVGQQVD